MLTLTLSKNVPIVLDLVTANLAGVPFSVATGIGIVEDKFIVYKSPAGVIVVVLVD